MRVDDYLCSFWLPEIDAADATDLFISINQSLVHLAPSWHGP
jgi:hypothetical protein